MSNLPPGVTESMIPGIDDEDHNYTVYLCMKGELIDKQEVVDYIKEEYSDYEISIDLDSYQVIGNTFQINFDLIGVISFGPRDNPDDIEQWIKEDLPSKALWECEYRGFDLND